MLGHLPHHAITGEPGDPTSRAVASFQAAAGQEPTGRADGAVWAALPPEPYTPRLSEGDEGEIVAALQSALADVRGPGEDTDPGPADGYFGPMTDAAVRAYQRDRRLDDTGVVDDATWWVPADGEGTTLASLARLITG